MKFFTIVKKQLALMLLLIMTLMTPAVLSAADGKLVMIYTAAAEITVQDWTNTTVNGQKAWILNSSSINGGKMQNNDTVISVVIPEGVTEISGGAFQGCANLKSVVIPGTVKTISGGAFQGCTALTDLELGYGIQEISGGAFGQCTSLATLTIPGSVTSFGTNGTFGNGNLSDVEIEDGVKELGYIFQGCTSLQSIVIPGSVKNIPAGAFNNCSNLTNLVLGEGVESIGSGAFQGCSGIESLVIPGSIKNIQDNAFQNCTNLTSVEFGDGVAKIGNSAFQGCPIEEVVLPGSVDYVGWNAFDNYTSVNVTVGSDGKVPETNTKIDLKLNDDSSVEALISSVNNDKVASVTYSRPMSAVWGTICLPFDTESNDEIRYYELTGVDLSTGVVQFEAIKGVVKANTPCVIQRLTDLSVIEAKASAVNVSDLHPVKTLNATGWIMVGTYVKEHIDVITPSSAYYQKTIYGMYGSQLSRVATTANLKPFRAFFEYDGPASAAASRFSIEIADEFSTGINSASVEAQEEGVLYDLAGNRVNNMVKGQVYLLDGQKVMFK